MLASRRVVAIAATAGLLTGFAALPAQAAASKIPSPFQNCTALNKSYPHGVGKKGAKDHVANPKKDKPVTTFRVDTALYTKAMKYNKGLDRDKDGVACEKR